MKMDSTFFSSGRLDPSPARSAATAASSASLAGCRTLAYTSSRNLSSPTSGRECIVCLAM